MKRILILIGCLFWLTACSSLPDDLVSEDHNAEVMDNYQQWVNTSPDSVLDVRMGGVISKVTNLKDKSRIEIVNLPISSSGRPDITQEPQGRFIAYVKGFIEPMTYTKGRLITVVGKGLQPETDKVGEYDYTFPVMEAYGQHLWTIETTTYVENDAMMGGCFRGGFRCGAYGYGPSRTQVIQQVK